MNHLVLPLKLLKEKEAFKEDVWVFQLKKNKKHCYFTNVSYLVMQEFEDTVSSLELTIAQGRGSPVRH